MLRSLAPYIVRTFVASLVAAILGISIACCARHVTGTARAEPMRTFPELGGFKDVDMQHFYTPERGGPVIRFSTTVGVQCKITLSLLSCGGRLATSPYALGDNPCGSASPTGYGSDGAPESYQIERSDGVCPSTAPQKYPILEVDHKLVVDWRPNFEERFTCAVGPPERIACIDLKNHGFVIEPSGAWTF